MRISVIGLGYVGLVTSAGFAEWGHEVVGVEASPEKLHALKKGRVPFHEPGLAEMVKANLDAGRLTFVAPGPHAIHNADLVVTAVGTHDGNGGWQTDTMLRCLRDVVPHMGDEAALIVRSTLPPQFIRELPELVGELRAAAGKPTLPVLTNPEFTREGRAVRDFMEPERIIFGIASDPGRRGVALVSHAYQLAQGPVLVMNAVDAAFAKLGSNLFLATKISFANELAALCEAHGADITQVVAAMALDSRIGGKFLGAGVGFGGSCLPHQVTMTAHAGIAEGVPTPLISAVDAINHDQRRLFVDRMEVQLGGSVAGRRVALLGLTFKPDTDDLRDAPALSIARILHERGATVVAYDPMASARLRAAALVDGLETVASVDEALDGADAVGLVTEWSEFAEIDWAAAARRMNNAVVVDGRNFLDPSVLSAAGFQYVGFGRRPVGDAEHRTQVNLTVGAGGESIPVAIPVPDGATISIS